MSGPVSATPLVDMSFQRHADALGRYRAAFRRQLLLLTGPGGLLGLLAVLAVAMGPYGLGVHDVAHTLLGEGDAATRVVVWNVRLPRIVAAIVVGWALGLAGLATQSLLRNPLASPFTLGISHGAAFGAALAIVWLQAGTVKGSALRVGVPASVFATRLSSGTLCAFLGALLATVAILALAPPEDGAGVHHSGSWVSPPPPVRSRRRVPTRPSRLIRLPRQQQFGAGPET